MDCPEARPLLPLSLDRELEARTEAALAAHVAACDACASVRQRLAAAAAVRGAARYHRAPATLRADIAAALPDGAANGRRRPRRVAFGSRVWRLLNGAGLVAAACAALVLAVVLPLRPSADARLADEAVAGHVRALLTNHVIDVASTDQHTVKPWFNGKLDFSPPVPDLAAQGFELVGGRLDYLDRHPVAVVVYRRGRHLIDVFVWPAAAGAAAASPYTLQGYHVMGKVRAGMAFRAVSDVAPADLQELVDAL
ncbi:MAG: zf-HC2 domain-containing protein [Rhodocyclaceae bacterium]|nr:zf-HC2 domain-containing protein [Rhodocyclaceae bacterium]